MGVFVRRKRAPEPRADYRQYRYHIRADFCACCAYCLIHEILAGGADNFELDHFRPKSDSRFKRLATDYYNLYYSCHVCNHYKAAAWPRDELIKQGYNFVDFCSEKFSAHFQEKTNGEWAPLSKAAEYTAERLRLNRSHLLTVRELLRQIAAQRGLTNLNWDEPSRDQILVLLGLTDAESGVV
jgi:HNH endonuclease